MAEKHMDSKKQPAEGKKRQATLFGFGVVTSKLQNEHQAKKTGEKRKAEKVLYKKESRKPRFLAEWKKEFTWVKVNWC